MDDLLNELGPDVGEQGGVAYLPGYGPIPSTPPPSYDEAVKMKAELVKTSLPPSQMVPPTLNMMVPPVATNNRAMLAGAISSPAAIHGGMHSMVGGQDEWEEVVISKPGFGILLHPVKRDMSMDDVLSVVKELEKSMKIRLGKAILLRVKEMAYVDCRDTSTEQTLLYKRTITAGKGIFKVMSRKEVFGMRMAERMQQVGVPTGAAPRDPAAAFNFSGAPAPKRVRSLSLSSTTTSSSDSTDSRGFKKTRRDKRKLRRKIKKERRRRKDMELAADPFGTGLLPPPPSSAFLDPSETFLLQPSHGPPECKRCRTSLRRDFPDKCPACGAPLRRSDNSKRDRERPGDRDNKKKGRDRDYDRPYDNRDRDRDRGKRRGRR